MNKKLVIGPLIGLSIFIVIFAALIILPYSYRVNIMKLAKAQVASTLDAEVSFENVSLSFIRNFPNATLRFENIRIIGNGEFQKDTLLFSENIDLMLSLRSLFSAKGYEIHKLQITNSRIFAHVLPNGNANWSILKSRKSNDDRKIMIFILKLKRIIVNQADVIYWNEAGNLKAEIKNLHHKTLGDLSARNSMLETKTTIDTLSFWMNDIKYISKATAELIADINLNKNLFSFSENSCSINSIPFSITGWFKTLQNGGDMDMTLEAQKIENKAILSMIPTIFNATFSDLKEAGDVAVNVSIKGLLVDKNCPEIDFNLASLNGKFQYPKLLELTPNLPILKHTSIKKKPNFHKQKANLNNNKVELHEVKPNIPEVKTVVPIPKSKPVIEPKPQVRVKEIKQDKVVKTKATASPQRRTENDATRMQDEAERIRMEAINNSFIKEEQNRIQRENNIKAAHEKADWIRSEAQKTGERLMSDAKMQGDLLINQATTPNAKKEAEISAQKLVDEAMHRNATLISQAYSDAEKLIQEATTGASTQP